MASYMVKPTAKNLKALAGTLRKLFDELFYHLDDSNFDATATKVHGVGDIIMTGSATARTGWLLCDATAYSRTTYADLFAAIGTTYGAGDGSTTFNVPDMRGRVPVGVGTGTGGGASGTGLPAGGSALTARARAAWLGGETHTLTTDEMPLHTHTQQTRTGGGGQGVLYADTASSVGADAAVNISSTGGGGAHNNVQPAMCVNFMIKF